MKQAKEYFDNHGSVDLLYFTSDNLAFFDERNALNHAKQLEDDTVTSMTREEAEQAVTDLVDDEWDEDLPEYLGID